jgi:hypothetical protein
MNKLLTITNSYIQNDKHDINSDKYNVINPSVVGEVMSRQGLQLQTLSTGKARHADKADFQRTLARYRGPSIGDGIFLDIIHDSKKLGRGCDELLLGIYRVVCTNGLVTGKSFSSVRIRHSGNTYEQLDHGIAALLTQQGELTRAIKAMQSTEFTAEREQVLVGEALRIVVPNDAFDVVHRLTKVRREADNGRDLWSMFNVIQENIVQGKSIAYKKVSIDETKGLQSIRQYTSRPVKPNTNKDRVINAALFDAALKLVA